VKSLETAKEIEQLYPLNERTIAGISPFIFLFVLINANKIKFLYLSF